MPELHILQGGNDNGDKAWLERAAVQKLNAPRWVAPKAVALGDQVVIFIGGYGFFATARIRRRLFEEMTSRRVYPAGVLWKSIMISHGPRQG